MNLPLCIASHVDGDLHGACTVLQHDDAMYCRSYGAKDDVIPNEYFVLGYYTPISISRDLSSRYLHVGRGTEEAKAHRGATFPPRWTYFIGTGAHGALA
ncbi:hypothetical protein SAMN05421595_0245 [Austwickia chelonae]|uniref:Uncharacterized protein n=1 Tax=Austwickia chelonae NBRC 105200 TaxID=1184607 RepID=K6UM24_9MICO|nr:hypothetical protein AUCHE_06_00130 [Austwickia chelonae NBRC 105200]SEV88637.1 hypothetical protein SAMN05421595_0245 [Austwickia chelonae]